jgi:hypothetical protein
MSPSLLERGKGAPQAVDRQGFQQFIALRCDKREWLAPDDFARRQAVPHAAPQHMQKIKYVEFRSTGNQYCSVNVLTFSEK